jgi:uncharacterized protein
VGKLLVLAIVVLLLLWWLPRLRRAARRDAAREQARDEAAPAAEPSQPALQDMVSCAHCGVHLPQQEACIRDRTSYCSPEHAQAGRRSP